MGRNKHIQTLIAGQMRTITRHPRKIEEEITKPFPNAGHIRGWEREPAHQAGDCHGDIYFVLVWKRVT